MKLNVYVTDLGTFHLRGNQLFSLFIRKFNFSVTYKKEMRYSYDIGSRPFMVALMDIRFNDNNRSFSVISAIISFLFQKRCIYEFSVI